MQSEENKSVLTAEQIKRIETNRAIALAKCNARANNSTLSDIKTISNGPESIKPVDEEIKKRIEANREKALALIKDRNRKLKNGNAENGQKPEKKLEQNVCQNALETLKKSNSRTFTAVCTLISSDRFAIECGFNEQLQQIFKSMPSRRYDIKTRNWNFDISDYERLQQSAQQLRPHVVIGSIPMFVFRLLRASSHSIQDSFMDNISSKIATALMPFQEEGVRFAVSNDGRVLIADDMGLGKTIQAIAIADYYRSEWPVLCVVPSSVRYSWAQAFTSWLPDISTSDICILNTSRDNLPKDSKIILTSYDLLSKCRKQLSSNNYRVVIMDESHFLKNFKSGRTQAAREVVDKCHRLIMLSGTPALSRPSELYPQLNMLKPKIFNNFTEFGIRYCNGKKVPWGNGWNFSGSSNMKELQVLLTKNLMIRRLKSNVLSQLPSKQRSMVILDPSLIKTKTEMMKDAEQKMLVNGLSSNAKHGALLQYFNQSAHAKINAVRKYIADLIESDRKFLCFAHHQTMLDSICDFLDENKVKYIRIDGRTSSEKRKVLCDDFQVKDIKVAVLSITAANAGITLTAASLVVFAELFWNPGILTQAEDRVHRLGQQDMVNVHYLVAKGTADDFLWPLVQKKLDVLNKAGLSKDNFKNADTGVTELKTDQRSMLEFLEDVEDIFDDDSFQEISNDSKRLKTS